MKHPLSSKERRGLVAVAAAALLCIASGFIVRSCSHNALDNKKSSTITTEKDSLDDASSNNHSKSHKSDKSHKTNRAKKSKKSNKPKKSYPTRDPLSQPCD